MLTQTGGQKHSVAKYVFLLLGLAFALLVSCPLDAHAKAIQRGRKASLFSRAQFAAIAELGIDASAGNNAGGLHEPMSNAERLARGLSPNKPQLRQSGASKITIFGLSLFISRRYMTA